MMGNPLLMLTTRPWRVEALRRRRVPIPTDLPSTDAVFLVLRRMRVPLIAVMGVFAISVLGLTLIPGVDEQGQPYHLTIFDAFYFMSYTAATIGFSETPHTFTIAQRMWVTVCIFASVTTWAYALGSLFALFQDTSFRRALSLQSFRRRVRRLREPFCLLVGYGEAGRTLARELDAIGRRVVVLDEDPDRIDILVGDQLTLDVPNFAGDPRNPSLLGFAGLGHPMCEAVLAMTDKDEMNLAVIMASQLLRPGLPAISRCSERVNIGRMEDFAPLAVINPYDRYGDHLALALKHPVTAQLSSWLTAPPGSRLPKRHHSVADGRWVVVSDGPLGREIADNLGEAELSVDVVDPAEGDPDVTGAVGLVAACHSDALNLSLAAHARLENPDIFISLRQRSSRMMSLVRAFSPDAVFIATHLVASETLARLEAPLLWSSIEHLRTLDDETAATVLRSMVDVVGSRTPLASRITLDDTSTPAVTRWLRSGGQLTLGQLLTDPDEDNQSLAVFPTVLVNENGTRHLPALDEPLHIGDQIGALATMEGKHDLLATLFSDWIVEYLATGTRVPQTWIWRRLTRHRQASATRMPKDADAA